MLVSACVSLAHLLNWTHFSAITLAMSIPLIYTLSSKHGLHCMQSSRATLEVTIKPESGLSSPRERLLEELVTSCCKNTVLCELHPHTALSITLQVENDDGLVRM